MEGTKGRRHHPKFLPLMERRNGSFEFLTPAEGSRLLRQLDTESIYLIPLRHSRVFKCGTALPLLDHLLNWKLEFTSGFAVDDPQSGSIMPVIIVSNCSADEALTLATMSGFANVYHIYKSYKKNVLRLSFKIYDEEDIRNIDY